MSAVCKPKIVYEVRHVTLFFFFFHLGTPVPLKINVSVEPSPCFANTLLQCPLLAIISCFVLSYSDMQYFNEAWCHALHIFFILGQINFVTFWILDSLHLCNKILWPNIWLWWLEKVLALLSFSCLSAFCSPFQN